MTRKTKELIKKTLSVCFASAGILACIASSAPSFAEGAGGTPGGGSSTCSNRRQAFGAVCGGSNAFTWVYYTLDRGGASFKFPGSSGAVGTATIRGCSTGFWHLGYYINRENTVNHPYVQNDGGWYTNPNRTGSVLFNSSSGDAAAQVGSRNTNYVNNNGSVWDASNANNSLIDGAKLAETGGGGGNTVTAHYYGAPSRVQEEFNIAVNGGITFYNDDGDVISTPSFNEVAWFCYDETMNETTYTGSTQIYDGSTAKDNNYVVGNTGAPTYNIKFSHNIHRNSDGPTSADNEQYYINGSDKSVGSSSSPASVNMNRNDNYPVEKTISVSLKPGETKTVWQTLHYESDSNQSSPNETPGGECYLMKNANNENIKGRYCAKLSRNEATFTGSVAAKVNGGNVITDNNTSEYITSDKNGYYTVIFEDKITRGQDGAGGNDVDNAWSATISLNGNYVGEKNIHGTLTDFKQGDSKLARSYGNNYGYSGYLKYGETHTICNNLTYQNRISESRGNTNKSVSICVNVKRYPATFTGTASAKINNVAKANNSTTTITSSDGSYTVNFQDTIKRNVDGAGGTIGSAWSARISKNNSYDSSKDKNGTTGNLSENGSKNVLEYSNYSYSGKLRYDETHTICNKLTYESVVNQISGNTNSSTTICVKVYREKAKCAIDNNFTYGIYSGRNAGKISVEDSTLSTSKSSNVALTDSKPNDAISIFARPGDKVRFKYDMCAGSLYTIKENNLSRNTSYTASGWSSKQTTVNNNNKFLFRTEVPLVGNTYNNPRTWSSGNAASGSFLSDSSHVVSNFLSPSSGAGTNYRCGLLQDGGWYQVAGKEECGRNVSEYNTAILDVGSTLSQKLEWDEQPISNVTLPSSAHARSATANVVIPYNYELQPYVTNSSLNGRPAYIGETISMTPGVATKKRTNANIVTNDNSKKTYSTISKNTEVKYFYYFTDSAGNLKGSRQQAHATETRRFNADSNLNGANETLDVISVEIDDSHLVGDRVCIELSIFPFESHDGINDGAVALKETSSLNASTQRRATASCLTIAKRPTMSVESSNVYSASKITTSYYSKKISSNKFVFSSWSEYGVYGLVNKNFLMASGAASGYRRDGYANNKQLNNTRTNPADGNVSRIENSNECTFMTQTFANKDCNQDESAKRIGGITAEQYESRMLERFKDVGNTLAGTALKKYNKVDYLDASNINKSDFYDASANLIGVKANNMYLSKTPTFADDDHTNHTVVYHAKNLVIDGDLNKELTKELTTISNITGVLIFADNVYITDDTRYINATIIADKVNTCAFQNADPTKMVTFSLLNSGSCNKSLIFDAPVITKRLILNRTAGATNGENSIVRAEVFNLNTGNYLWSYGQMSRYNQAITTYSRELPPRY